MTLLNTIESENDDPAVAPLRSIAGRVRWIATAIVDAANRGRSNSTGIKVGGHQASSASMVEIMVALWFHELTNLDRVAVKPHASPVLHAINYLLGDLDGKYLTTLREKGGLQSYPSRIKDPDTVDFSTGSVGIGATAPLWAAFAHRYIRSQFVDAPPAGRFISLLGDAELDEGAIWEAVADPSVAQLGELLWVVDLNRQSLDRVVPDIQIARLQGMFGSAGWEVITLKWGRRIGELFAAPGGGELRSRLEQMPNEEYQRMLRTDPSDVARRLVGDGGSRQLLELVESLPVDDLAAAVRDLGGHDLGLLIDTFRAADIRRPTVVFAYTIKGNGLPTEGHPNNHSALLTEAQMQDLAVRSGVDLEDPWQPFPPGSAEYDLCANRREQLRRVAPPPPPAGQDPHSAGPRPPQTPVHPGHARPVAGRSEARRAGNRGACRHLQSRRGVVDEPGRLDQQDRRLVRARPTGLVRRRHRAGPALVHGPGRPTHRTRHRRGQPGVPIGRTRGDLEPVGRTADPHRHHLRPVRVPRLGAMVLRHLRRWSVHPGRHAVRGYPRPGGGRPPIDHHSVDRHGAARLRGLGTRVRS